VFSKTASQLFLFLSVPKRWSFVNLRFCKCISI